MDIKTEIIDGEIVLSFVAPLEQWEKVKGIVEMYYKHITTLSGE